jgi:hypothetical protein
MVAVIEQPPAFTPKTWGYYWEKVEPHEYRSFAGTKVMSAAGFEIRTPSEGVAVTIPFFAILVIASMCGIAPWTYSLRRFSLRTMLIATTLIAFMLGLAIWLTR